jgi:hypothetical protein
MLRVALTDAAYDVIASTLPKGAARWPMQRDRCQWLHPSRGGGGRPHEAHSQAWRELQRSHLAARRIEDKRLKMSCATGPAVQFCELEGEQLSELIRRRTRADPSEYTWPRCAIGRGPGPAHSAPLSFGQVVPHVDKGLQKPGKNPPQGLSYC